MHTYPTLYTYDNANRIRVWWMEREDNKHRSVAGLQDGQKVVSEWTVCKGKNVGRSNETSPEEQAEAEVAAHYKKKKKQNHYASIAELDAAGGSSFFEPMLAQKFDLKRIKAWPVYSQPKLDGIRCIFKDGALWSRTGEPILSCPHVIEDLTEFTKTHIFDGELYNHDLKDDFNEITSIVKRQKFDPDDFVKSRRTIQYHIYDMVFTEKELTFSQRLHAIRNMADADYYGPSIQLVRTDVAINKTEVESLLGLYLQQGYEGQMIRLDGIPYENKRSYSLMKNKNFVDDEFVVLDIHEGNGNWSGKAKTATVVTKAGVECDATFRGKEAYLAQVLIDKAKYIGKRAKVRYQNFTPDGKLRFATILELDRTW